MKTNRENYRGSATPEGGGCGRATHPEAPTVMTLYEPPTALLAHRVAATLLG